jgi:hypothetical protein
MQALDEPAHALLERRHSEEHKRKAVSAAPAGRYASAAQKFDQPQGEDRRQRTEGEPDANPNEHHEPARTRAPTFAPKTRPNP